MVQSYGHFTEGVDVTYWWSCSGKGSRLEPAQQACLELRYPLCLRNSKFPKTKSLTVKTFIIYLNFCLLKGFNNVTMVGTQIKPGAEPSRRASFFGLGLRSSHD